MFSGFKKRISRSFVRATEVFSGLGPTPVKQFKKAITDCDEEKAILIYTSSIDNHDNSNTNGNGQSGANDGTSSPDSQATSSQLATIVHPSKPFPSKKNQSGDTPLHLAAKFALMKLIMLLLENGGIPSTLNARMETSLHSVCSMSNAADVRRRILDMIITYNGNDMHGRFEIVSVNQVDIDGNAAIHHAAANGLLSCVEKLVANNAIISIVNKSNFTCCEMADNNNYKELAHMLELALLFQKEDAGVEEFNRQQEFPYDKQTGKLLLLSSCLSLAGLNDFIEEAIGTVHERLNEERCRAEVMLGAYNWDINKLIVDFTLDTEKVLKTAKLEPKSIIPSEKELELVKLIEDSKNVSTVEKKTVNYNLDIDEIAIEDNDEEDEKNDGSKGDGPSPVNTLAMMMGKSVEANGHVLSLDDLTSNNKSKSSIAKKSLQNDMKTSIYDPYANNKETESCIICGETMLQSRPVDLFIKDKVAEPGRRELCCLSGHKYCVDCWSSHLLVQVNDNGLGCLPCPGYKCGEVLDLQWAPIMLKSQEYVNRLLAARHRQVIDCSGLKACPIENCGLLLHIPAVTGKKSTSKTLNPVEQHHPLPLATICDNGHAFCLSCFQQAHSPCSCADMQKWLQQVREETKDAEGKAEGVSGDDLANALWVAANTKRCPRCSTPIEKDEGCNHMSCRKCRKEFCWICMQDWSLHSDNTGGYFQCNRFIQNEDSGDNSSGWVDERGNAHAETMRLRERGRKMARFIHYFTRYKAHGDSAQMESKMKKETVQRITTSLHGSIEGKLRWLQGDIVKNPLEKIEFDHPQIKHAQSFKGLKGDTLSASNPPTPRKPVEAVKGNPLDAEQEEDQYSNHYIKSEECLDFLIAGFDELLRCRNLLQWSYPYAYFEFDDDIDHRYSARKSRWERLRLDDHRMAFEIFQADLESFVETLSDVCARRRLRASNSQIALATRAAKSKRIEFEVCFVTYANAKLEKLDDEPVAVGSGGTNRRSRPRFFHLGTNEVNRNNRTIRNNPVSMQSIESDEDAMDLAMMLHELEMAGYATSDFMGVESEPPTQSNVSRNSPAIIASPEGTMSRPPENPSILLRSSPEVANQQALSASPGRRSLRHQRSASHGANISNMTAENALIFGTEELGVLPPQSPNPSTLRSSFRLVLDQRKATSAPPMRDERDFTVDRAETFTNPMNHRRSQSFGSGGNSFSELNNNPSTVNRSSPLVNAVSPGVPIATRGLSENVHSISNNAINVPHPSRFSSAAVERLQRSSSMNMISSSGMAPNASRPQPIAFPPTNSSNTNINRSSAIADELYRSIVDEVVVQKEIAIDDDNQSFVSSISDSNSDDFVAPVRPPRTSRFNDNPQNLRMAEVSLDRNAAGPSRSGSRNQRPVQADPRIARLAQRAEEEAQLNRAILMSLQDPSPEQTSRVGNTSQLPSESDITMLTNMGFTRDQSVQALRESRNNVEMAANRLLGIN